MPDNRQHRGAHPSDAQLFASSNIPALRTATFELSWLLSRDYSSTAALKLVGDRHRLQKRRRIALSRAACSDLAVRDRAAKCLPLEEIRGEDLAVDGFNLLIGIEAALGGGVILLCRDGCFRDIASVHGSYRSVEETRQAILLIGNALERFAPRSVEWFFDKPVSNSGRLAGTVREIAEENSWPWTAELVFNPDTTIAQSPKIAVSSDSAVLDNVGRWINLSAYVIETFLPQAWIVDLQTEARNAIPEKRASAVLPDVS